MNTAIKTIDTLTRLNLSSNGNPRFNVRFTDGTSATTMSDASFCYGLENPELRNVPVVVTYTRAGRIEDIRLPKKADKAATVHTWADGFGRWHARVTFATPIAAESIDWSNVRRRARRAMRTEIIERQGVGEIVLRSMLESTDKDDAGNVASVVYAEKD